MNEQKRNFIEFKVLGENSHNCGFSLTGRLYTVGSEICTKIEQELQNGTLGIDIKDDKITFVFEGISIAFSEKKEKLELINEMLIPERNLRRESFGNAIYYGFSLMASG